MTGTLSKTDCQHLHLTVADSKCATYGGHATIGCLIRTTCEIALGVLDSVAFQVRCVVDQLYVCLCVPRDDVVCA